MGRKRHFPSSLLLVSLCLLLASCGWFSDGKKAPEKKSRVKASGLRSSARSAGQAQPGSVIRSIQERGEIRVGMQVGYVPFQMTGPDGTLMGLDVDSAHLVAHSLGVGLRIVRLDWAELIPAVREGTIDLIMSGMRVTPERNMEVVFTIPVLETGRMFLVHRKNDSLFRRFSDLDKPGIFVVSTPGGLGNLNVERSLPRAGYREFPDRAAALGEVIAGRAHAYVDEEFSIRLACAKRPEVLMGRFKPLTYEPMAWALRAGDPHWLNWLNNLIRAIRRDGRLDALKKKWLRDYYLDIGRESR